jgi:flagellar biosynthesis GTPase FlhF
MENKIEFYKESWFMWVSLVLFAPLGIFLMWKYGQLKENVKIVLSIVFAVMFLFIWVPAIVGSVGVNNNEKMIEQQAIENKEVVQTVEKKIKAIGDPKVVTLENSESIKSAKTAYNSLTNEQKGMVSYATIKVLVIADENVTTLENKAKEEKAIADKAAADKAATEKAAVEKATADKAAAEQAAVQAAATEQVSAQKAVATETQGATVYTTDTGTKYHADGCQYLSKSKIPISLEKAVNSGLTPCSKCNPPQ